ncbi:ATP synthase F1 subunit gamma [Candidatus Daviesbacteria bacterium RIFCSPHIGHO2_02_FULL_39_12]|uniref:ATP synthase gamma chain n=2 Tax=Candidatus Daviesiibacteriota TaxID=1752718 RepID=A0A1F5JAE0_9BACT|nr:MAG: ATP synthase F1 subunit gamma [Candidatus Daviesbacteria bacterium RIFCSPHIGHO2_02_FULL_39_12]OGE71700.1 MAG: ATP synthase F1 subunit gamma [Candidatus Daviesbacteria bacterium RIFCSPLOWO2_02_FULL_38_15]
MANTRELRRRIRSVKNTSQITKAMQMVAATKMRKAQNQAVNGRPYSGNLLELLIRLLPEIQAESHSLLGGKEIASSQTPRNDVIGVVVLSTDKGLVGALNTNIFRTISALHLPGVNVNFYTIGKKGRSFVARTGKDLQADFENSDVVTFRQAKQLARMLMDAYLNKEIGEAYLVYPRFVSTLRQEATRVKVLPIELESVIASEAKQPSPETNPTKIVRTPRNDESGADFLIEPNPDELLDELLTHFVEIRIYQALLETKASEHSARMIAMQNATDNAKELVGDLKLTYNQTRQDAITRELLEITSAAAALE